MIKDIFSIIKNAFISFWNNKEVQKVLEESLLVLVKMIARMIKESMKEQGSNKV